jgi:16S rRNA (adenine1518-N6/adenine1519-N6)-dimethyltransferase
MELNYNSVAELRAFLERSGLGTRKRYGQNFLINPAVRRSLVDALESESGAAVWEIGPGLGAMTALLLEKGLLVRAFEVDPGFARVLRELFDATPGFTLVEGDVMKTWPSQPAAPYLLGNLPYNIAAALIADLIIKGCFFRRAVITIQREVALRMAAHPGSADYSSFSVLCASVYKIKPLALIRAASFYPRPNVDSRGVRLELRDDINSLTYPSVFYPLVRRLFAARRKMIKNTLRDFINSGTTENPESLTEEILAQNRLTGSERAENLSLETFAALARTVEDMRTYIKWQSLTISPK